MSTFTGRHEATFPLRVPPEVAAAAFADLDRQIACHPELAAADKRDATTLAVRMKEMNHGPTKFAGQYTLRFEVGGTTVSWRTIEGNVNVEGEARFTAAGAGSRMAYRESVSLDLAVNALLGRVLRPVVEVMMARGMKGFIERMSAELDRVA